MSGSKVPEAFNEHQGQHAVLLEVPGDLIVPSVGTQSLENFAEDTYKHPHLGIWPSSSRFPDEDTRDVR